MTIQATIDTRTLPAATFPSRGRLGAHIPTRHELSDFSLNVQGTMYALIAVGTLYAIAFLSDRPFEVPYRIMAILAGLLTFAALRRFNVTQRWHFGRTGSDGNRVVLHWFGVVGALLLVAYTTQWSEYFSRQVLLLWFVLTPCALLALNSTMHRLARSAVPEIAEGRKAAIVFANETARRFAASARRSKSFDIVGLFEDRGLDRVGGSLDGLPLLGTTADAAAYIREHKIPVVFIFLSVSDCARVAELVDALGDTTASVYYVPDFEVLDRYDTRMISVESVPMFEIVETPFHGIDGVVKKLFDKVLAACALVVLSPLLLTVAMLIKLTSPGPVFFKQKRYGLGGEEFWIYKFRSMTVADRSAELKQVSRDDQRVTPVGRFIRSTSIDELPQLWNVIKGDMSLVGPRPHTVAHNEYYRKAVRRYMVRHKVRPGLTGLAQVEGFRGETVQLELMEQRVRCDLEYIRTWSPLLDLQIIFRTIGVILRRENAY